MDVETSIRTDAGVEKAPRPGFRELSKRRPIAAVSMDREEQLLRFVDILRAEQVRNAKRGQAGFHRWRGSGLLLLAVVIIATGIVAAFLQTSKPLLLHPDARPDPTVGRELVHLAPEPAHLGQRDLPQKIAQPEPPEGVAKVDALKGGSVDPASIRSVHEALSRRDADPSEPVLAKQQIADPLDLDIAEISPPPSAVTTQPASIGLFALRHEVDVLARRPRGTAELSESEKAKPVLRIYYPRGSLHAEANAQSLFARIEPNLLRSDSEAQTNLPNDAVIMFSEERNHELARVIGTMLGDAGYRWKIEHSIGSHRALIEVWLPR